MAFLARPLAVHLQARLARASPSTHDRPRMLALLTTTYCIVPYYCQALPYMEWFAGEHNMRQVLDI
eukprot:scaffold567400_cov59-Attheya_sp.AAC.1